MKDYLRAHRKATTFKERMQSWKSNTIPYVREHITTLRSYTHRTSIYLCTSKHYNMQNLYLQKVRNLKPSTTKSAKASFTARHSIKAQ